MAKKVATYCRVSMHNNAQQTLAQQQKRLQEYAEKTDTRFVTRPMRLAPER